LRILALQVPAVESGVLGPPAHHGPGVWYKHLDGGLPMQGVRFGGLKSDQFHLVKPNPVDAVARGPWPPGPLVVPAGTGTPDTRGAPPRLSRQPPGPSGPRDPARTKETRSGVKFHFGPAATTCAKTSRRACLDKLQAGLLVWAFIMLSESCAWLVCNARFFSRYDLTFCHFSSLRRQRLLV
jgi:hypothetical protein